MQGPAAGSSTPKHHLADPMPHAQLHLHACSIQSIDRPLCCVMLCCPAPRHLPTLPPGTERLRFLESELKEQRQLLRSMTLQRDSLQEDVWALKAAKKQSDEVCAHTHPALASHPCCPHMACSTPQPRFAPQPCSPRLPCLRPLPHPTFSAWPATTHHTTPYITPHHTTSQGWQQARQQSGELQKELEFFKASSARAIAERDRAAFDAQSLRTDLEATGSALQDSRSQLVLAQQVSQDLQGQLGSLQQQLEAEQQEAAAMRVQLRQAKQRHEQQLQQQRQAQQQLRRDLEDKQEVLKGVQV